MRPRCTGTHGPVAADALTCYDNPSNVTVHRIQADGTIGAQVPQTTRIDVGIFAHQVLTMPGNRSAIMLTRGNRPEPTKAEDPGALKIYPFQNGQLSPAANLPVGGKGARLRPPTSGLSPHAAVGVRLSGIAEPAATHSFAAFGLARSLGSPRGEAACAISELIAAPTSSTTPLKYSQSISKMTPPMEP